ncbi:MAG: alpha/beta hydrolase [Limisphaerales bacterium]
MNPPPPTIQPRPPVPVPNAQPAKRWIWPRVFVYGFLGGFILLNVLAWCHGRAMSRYASGADRTPPPEKLPLFGKIKVLATGVNLPRPTNPVNPKDYGMDYINVHYQGAFDVDLEAWQIEHATNHGLILMFHGHGSAKESLLPAAEIFFKNGWDCALVDFHGSGGSGTNLTSVGWHEATDVIESHRFFAHMYEDKPIILYGVSMGSAAVLRAIHIGSLHPHGVMLELPYDGLLNAARQRFRAMGLPSFPAAETLLFYGGMHGQFNAFAMNPANFAKSVKCPTLLMNGEIDRRAPPTQAIAVFDNLGGEKIHKQFQGLGHRNFARHDTENWSATTLAFLEDVLAKHEP